MLRLTVSTAQCVVAVPCIDAFAVQTMDQNATAEVIAVVHRLLDSIGKQDWETYASLTADNVRPTLRFADSADARSS